MGFMECFATLAMTDAVVLTSANTDKLSSLQAATNNRHCKDEQTIVVISGDKPLSLQATTNHRHCEERSDEAIHRHSDEAKNHTLMPCSV
jgi:hypothetical protein